MSRLIDIDAMSNEMYHLAFETDSDMQKWDGGCWIRYKLFERCRDNAPTIEAEPVRHGRWIIKGDPENGWYKITCSECGEDETAVAPCIGFMPNVKVIWDFCPNCGARMDGGGDNETD